MFKHQSFSGSPIEFFQAWRHEGKDSKDGHVPLWGKGGVAASRSPKNSSMNRCLSLLTLLLFFTIHYANAYELVIPWGTTYISNDRYMNQTNITSVVIPSSVTSIGGNAFRGCSGLTSINIPPTA